MNSLEYTPYTYLVGWSNLQKWYYGVRHAKKCHPSEFWVKYKTSSQRVKQLINEHGDPDIIQIRKTFSSAQKAIDWEIKVLKRMKVLHRADFLNMNIAGSVIIPKEFYIEHGKNRKNKISNLVDMRGEKNPMFGRMWINDGTNSKTINQNECIPEGWVSGRIVQSLRGRKNNRSFHCERNNSVFLVKKIWITNGKNNKLVFADSHIPENWYKGHSVRNKDSIKGSSKTMWITDGVNNKKIKKESNFPTGWRRGRTFTFNSNREKI